jgi:hypothetical protein
LVDEPDRRVDHPGVALEGERQQSGLGLGD